MSRRGQGNFAANVALAAGGAALITAGLAALVAGANGFGNLLDSEPDEKPKKALSAKALSASSEHYAKLDAVLAKGSDRVRRWLALAKARGNTAASAPIEPDDHPAALKFVELLASDGVGDGVPESLADVIERDIPRTCPDYPQLRSASGRDSLRRMLLAYAAMDPETGYVQGMNFLAAQTLIAADMNEVWAFALFASIMGAPFALSVGADAAEAGSTSASSAAAPPSSEATARIESRRLGLRAVYIDTCKGLVCYSELVFLALKQHTPRLWRHFLSEGVSFMHFFEMVLTLFSLHLPQKELWRVWDAYFRDGEAAILRVVIVLLRDLEPYILGESGPDAVQVRIPLHDSTASVETDAPAVAEVRAATPKPAPADAAAAAPGVAPAPAPAVAPAVTRPDTAPKAASFRVEWHMAPSPGPAGFSRTLLLLKAYSTHMQEHSSVVAQQLHRAEQLQSASDSASEADAPLTPEPSASLTAIITGADIEPITLIGDTAGTVGGTSCGRCPCGPLRTIAGGRLTLPVRPGVAQRSDEVPLTRVDAHRFRAAAAAVAAGTAEPVGIPVGSASHMPMGRRARRRGAGGGPGGRSEAEDAVAAVVSGVHDGGQAALVAVRGALTDVLDFANHVIDSASTGAQRLLP